MALAYLGIGTNLGDKAENINRAVELVERQVGRVLAVSTLYESEPWGFVSEHRFANVALLAETDLSPERLLAETQAIERIMGRESKTTAGYTDRIIDVDILFYDGLTVESEILKIPHPLLAERDFVVIPMAEIAPQFIHPTLHKSMDELAARYR